MAFGFGNSWDATGKTCYVTGGSQGLGLSVAVLLAKKGANVTVVARNVDRLKEAVAQLEGSRQSQEQRFRYHSFPLNTSVGSHEALEAECTAIREETSGAVSVPDAFFLCAGSARPTFFIENTEDQLVQGMEQAYWVQAWTAHAAMKALARAQHRGTLVFVGSTVSHMSFVGFAPYAPGKYALKGLAESLRSEGLLYGIDVHIFFAPTMDSPGLKEENRLKPKVTVAIEEGDDVVSCEAAAASLVRGVEDGMHHTSSTFIGKVFSNSNRGSAPLSNALLGPFYDLVAWIGLPIWRRGADAKILKHRQEHQQHLRETGFLSTS